MRARHVRTAPCVLQGIVDQAEKTREQLEADHRQEVAKLRTELSDMCDARSLLARSAAQGVVCRAAVRTRR